MKETEPKFTSPPPLWPFLFLCIVTAVWIDFGTIHRHHHADSIVPVLASLYHWTPFYWGTNRNGMLVPLLALPFKHPLVNLLVQDGLTIACGLAALFLLPRFVLRNAGWPYVAIFSTAAFLLLAPEPYRFSFLVDQPYAVSLALGLGGLVLLERTPGGSLRILRLVLALLLIGLAHWVNIGIGLFLSVLVIFRAVYFKADEETTDALMVLAMGFGSGLLWMQLAHYHETAEGIRSPAQWAQGWSRLACNTWTALAPHRWPIALSLTAALGLLVSLCFHPLMKHRSVVFRGAAVFLLAALLYGAFVGILEWVERGSFMERYTIPSVLLIHTGLSVLAAAPLCALLEGKPRGWLYAVASLVLIAASFSYGNPSFAGVQDDINERLGSRTADILEARCTHVVGNYWVVWPTVFHANLVRYQRGEPGVIWGVSFRSDPTREQIKQVPVEQMRVAIPHEDKDAPGLLHDYGFPPLVVAETRPTVEILCPRRNPKE